MTPAEEIIARHGIQLSRTGYLVFPFPVSQAVRVSILPHEAAIVAELRRRALAERIIPMPVTPRRPGEKPEPPRRDWREPGITRWQEAERMVRGWKNHARGARVATEPYLHIEDKNGDTLEVPGRLKVEVLAVLWREAAAQDRHASVGLRWLESSGGGAA